MTLKRKLFRDFWANLFFRLAAGETRFGLRKNPDDAFTFLALCTVEAHGIACCRVEGMPHAPGAFEFPIMLRHILHFHLKDSAADVGQATTRAVVTGITAILASDGIFAVLCNALHI